MAKRTRYQYGTVEINQRVNGPDVWVYRWWEPTADGGRTRKGFTVGTVDKYRSRAQALKAAEGMRLIANRSAPLREPIRFGGVLDRFLIELEEESKTAQITHATFASYRSMINTHIRPKWGDFSLEEVKPAPVQEWLRLLAISPKYKGHLRSLMHRLFDKAMLWELIPINRNPIALVEVRGISKRKKRPRILTVEEVWSILAALAQPYRTMVLVAQCFGLRVSEILGLVWTDFDFKRGVMIVQRSSVGKRLNRLKTEYSQDEIPLEPDFVAELEKWKIICPESEKGWVFPSPVTGRPYHADSLRTDYLIPTGTDLKLGRIGWHVFRHTYRAWLDETEAPIGVQQKLMRHAHISTTMDQYGNASMEAKRKANRPVIQRVLKQAVAQ